jgi:predicted PurR-regulated permease PerM
MSFPAPTHKQARILWSSLTALAIVLVVALAVIGIGWLFGQLTPVLLPVAIALMLAYILDPAVNFFVRLRISRLWAILLVFLIAVMVVAGILGSVIPGMIKESRKLASELPKDAKEWHAKLVDFSRTPIGKLIFPNLKSEPKAEEPSGSWYNPIKPAPPPANTNVQVILNITDARPAGGTNESKTNTVSISANSDSIVNMLKEPISEMVMRGLTKCALMIAQWIPEQLGNVTIWMDMLIGIVLVPVYVFYFLLEKKRINRSWPDYLPIQESQAKEELIFVLRAINDCMIVFFRGQVLVALCVGVLLTVGYLILGLNYAVLLGAIAAMLGIVPYLGTITSLLFALTVATVQFSDWQHPLIVLGIAAVVKMLEDFVISPKIIGNRSGMHPVTVIIAVLIGAKLMGGFLGALVAVPLTATLRTLMFRYVWKRRETKPKKEEPQEAVKAG